jgi:hypothetical protein
MYNMHIMFTHARADTMVVKNNASHMQGNVYVQFLHEKQAQSCLEALEGRYFAGYPVKCEVCVCSVCV